MTASCKHDLATLIFLMRKKLQIFENQKSLNRQKVFFVQTWWRISLI